MIVGTLALWSWRIARWLIDIKDGVKGINERLDKVDTRQSKLEASVNQLWEVAGWVRSKLGEPMPERRE
jgi:hypothetical protein